MKVWGGGFRLTETKHALVGDRKTRGKTGKGGGGWHERRRGGVVCREPSCAKYLTLCVDPPKVRFVLGAYGFSHAGVLLSSPGRRHSHKERGPPSPFFPLLLTPSLKLKFPLSLLPCPPLHSWSRNATQQDREQRDRETLERKAGKRWQGRAGGG